jgi:hypothetical protein
MPVVGGLVLTAALAAAAQPPAHQSVTSIPGFLNGVSAVSASDAWAVGYTSSGQPLIMHWDGTSWSPERGPSIPSGTLRGVSMVSATDGWAVGTEYSATAETTLIEHWDGTHWTRVPSPSPRVDNQLAGVSMASVTDGWAVGWIGDVNNNVYRALLLHWDGTRWTRVPVSVPVGMTELWSVSAASAADAWAVGLQTRNLGNLLLLHWNGSSWSEAPGPLDRAVETIPGVSDAAPGNAWIVGNRGIPNTTAVATLTLHWNGTMWRPVPSPSPGQSDELRGVAIVSTSDVWAVGEHGTSTGRQAPLTVHWNGASWVRVPNPGGTSDSSLTGVSMVSATDGWAVGGDLHASTGIIFHWNGTTWAQP